MNHLSAKTLFHRDDPETSREAAEKIVESGKLNKQEKLVYDAIKWFTLSPNQPPATALAFTAKELTKWTNLNYYTIQRRLSGLYRKGYIERTGEKREGCCVWRLIKER